jgi:hypothetical protein
MGKFYTAVILMTTLISGVMTNAQLEMPSVEWLHTVGSATARTVSDDWAGGMAFDPAGHVYIAGGSGSFHEYDDAILVKLNPRGELQWTILLDGGEGMRVVVDPEGDVFLAGHTGLQAFLAKFNSSGRLEWNTVWGIPGTSSWLDGWYDVGVAIDARGNVYVSGTVYYPPMHAFLAKFDSVGNVDWSRAWNYANKSTGADSVAVDATGNACVAGYVGNDTFLARFDSNGVPQWSRVLGEDNLQVRIREVALDASGDIYGGADSEVWTANGLNSSQVLLLKFSPYGSPYWAKTLGTPPAADLVYGLAIDEIGDLYVVGDRWVSVFEGQKDLFLTKFGSDGKLYWDVWRFARCYSEQGYCDVHSVGLAVDHHGGIYVGGTVSNALPEAYPPVKLNGIVTDSNITILDPPLITRDPGFTFTKAALKASRVNFTLDGSSRDEMVVVKLQQETAYTQTTTETTGRSQTSSIISAPVPFLDFPGILIAILLGLFVVARRRRSATA